MKLIVGLGNPGERYSFTRHNIGFLIAETLAEKYGITITASKYDACFGRGSICATPVILTKPQTFMNLSGSAVGRIARFFKVDTRDIIVIHDDLDLQWGDVRVKSGGGDGGHKGLGSVIYHLGDIEFTRVRIGIGRPEHKGMIESYVLQSFSEEEKKLLPDIVARACNAVVEVISSGTQAAMNKCNRRVTKNSSKEV